MSRSVWKVPYISNTFFSSIFRKKRRFDLWDRSSVISKSFINKRFRVHNGAWLLSIVIRASMVGHKFGEFSFTKKMGRGIHSRKDKKKKIKK